MPATDFDPTNPGSYPVPRMSQYAYREKLDGIGIKISKENNGSCHDNKPWEAAL